MESLDAAPEPVDDGWQWALVEVFGHRSHAGRAREEERFGTKMLRIDIPIKGDAVANGWNTHYYGGSAIFSFTLTDEATVAGANKPYERPAITRLAPSVQEPDDEDESEMQF